MSESKLFWKLARPSRSSLSVTSSMIDADCAELGDRRARRRRTSASTVRATFAVIAERVDRRRRHRVHRVRTDELLDVHHVAVGRDSSCSCSPRAGAARVAPCAASAVHRGDENSSRKQLVRELRVGDRRLALAAPRALFALARRRSLARRVEPLVDLRVDAADEEARHRRDVDRSACRPRRDPRVRRCTRRSRARAPRSRRAA